MHEELGQALKAAHLRRTLKVSNLFARYAQVTSPGRRSATGINRLLYDVGRFGVPVALGYYGGYKAGLWGQEGPTPQPPQYAMNQAPQRISLSQPPSGGYGGEAPFKHSSPSRLVGPRGGSQFTRKGGDDGPIQ